jgi:hypothetical protein
LVTWLARPGRNEVLLGHEPGAEKSGYWAREGAAMDDSDVDVLGPIDYLVVEFPADKANFSGEGMDELKKLVDGGLVHILDLLFLAKDADGSFEAMEAHEYVDDDAGMLRELGAEAAEILAAEDVEAIADVLEPDTIAAVLVWENTWAAPFASALRRSGGQLVANGRIPMQGILAAMEADDEALEMEGV